MGEPIVVQSAEVIVDGPLTKRQPVRIGALFLAAVQAVLGALSLLDIIDWSVEQMGGVMGAIAAVTILVGESVRARVSPVAPSQQGI